MPCPAFPVARRPSGSSDTSATTDTKSSSTNNPAVMDAHDKWVAKMIVLSILSVYGMLAFITITAWVVRVLKRQMKPPVRTRKDIGNKTGTVNLRNHLELPVPSPAYSMKKRNYDRKSYYRRGDGGLPRNRYIPKTHSPVNRTALDRHSLERGSFSFDLDRNVEMGSPRYPPRPRRQYESRERQGTGYQTLCTNDGLGRSSDTRSTTKERQYVPLKSPTSTILSSRTF